MANRDKKFLLINKEIDDVWNASNLTEYQINDIDRYSIPYLARYEDRNSMAHSIETRLPFLDHRLVEFLLSLDVKYKIKNGWNKYILRKSFEKMPSEIRWRKDKKGFTVPEELWLKNDFKEDIIANFKNSRLQEAGIIREDYFIDYYHQYLSGKRRINNFDISGIYIIEKWLKYFFN
jgi:asparagine synthase (glutamine-hydrolysing)